MSAHAHHPPESRLGPELLFDVAVGIALFSVAALIAVIVLLLAVF